MPPMPQCERPSAVERRDTANPGCLRTVADLRQPGDPRRGVGGLQRLGRIEAGAFGGSLDLPVGRDVLALAEERLVERVAKLPQAALLGRPETRRERQGRARLVPGQVDLDTELERPAVDVRRPVGTEMVAARLEQRLRGRSQLEREPLDDDGALVLCRLDRVRLEVRVRADEVEVEADRPRHAGRL